jgi:hypothetical protein
MTDSLLDPDLTQESTPALPPCGDLDHGLCSTPTTYKHRSWRPQQPVGHLSCTFPPCDNPLFVTKFSSFDMTARYSRSHSQSSVHDHHYSPTPSSSTGMSRTPKRNVRPSPMGPTPIPPHVTGYASTYKTRPGLVRAPVSAPSVPHAPSYASSRRSHDSCKRLSFADKFGLWSLP